MKSQTKILLLTEQWAPEVGGVQRYLSDLSEELEKSFQVEVLHPSVRKFSWSLIKPSWFFLFVHLWNRARRKEFDVLLCGKGLFEGLVGYYLNKYLGVPYVIFTYAMEVNAWSENAREKRKFMRALSRAEKVVYINDVTKKKLLDLGVRQEKLIRVYPAVENPNPSDPAPLPHSVGGNRSKYVLCVARLIKRKGVDDLISAFAKLDQIKFGDVKLKIVGDGLELENLKKVAEQEMISSSVEFLGEVSDEALEKLYAGADVFAMTPRDIEGDIEGFGMVYLEAARFGVPSVGTKTGGVPEAVLNNETGFLSSLEDIDAVKNNLEKILGDKDLRNRLGENARSRVKEEFSWEKQVRPLRRYLSSLQ